MIILYTNALFGHGLRSLLSTEKGFEVARVMPKDADLAAAIRSHQPDVIILEGERLSSPNAQALLEAAWGEPRVRIVNIRGAATQPTVWRAVTIVPQGQESAADALERALAADLDAPDQSAERGQRGF